MIFLARLLQTEHFSDRSGRLHVWHQKISLLPGENVLTLLSMDLSISHRLEYLIALDD